MRAHVASTPIEGYARVHMDPIRLIECHAREFREYGAQKIGVFGSMARGEGSSDSDVDIYLEFADGMRNYDNFYAIHGLLGSIFCRRVDLVTDGSLTEGRARIILPTVRYAAINT